ncbi:hypothetical protein L7F22_036730 [Adiantum nelumboides]|nr:hypothetical protein [Adiantum nelumboides]
MKLLILSCRMTDDEKGLLLAPRMTRDGVALKWKSSIGTLVKHQADGRNMASRRLLLKALSSPLHTHFPSVASIGRCLSLHVPSPLQRQFVREYNLTTPRFKVKIKKDRPLDGVAAKVKELHPVIVIRDLILKFPKKAIPFRLITMKRRDLGLKMSDDKVEHLMKRYPNAFEYLFIQMISSLGASLPLILLTS